MSNASDTPQRTRVVKAAAALFAERGYHAVGMSDIQQAVGIGRGALYHHIRSKEDLLYDITRQYISDLVDFAVGLDRDLDPRERIQSLGCHLIQLIASHKSELTVCFRETRSLTGERQAEVVKLHAAYERAWRDVFVDGAEMGVFRPYDPIVLKALVGMYFHSFLWIRPDGSLSPAEVANTLNDIAYRALAPNGPDLLSFAGSTAG